MTTLYTWPLADAQATAFIAAMGAPKLCGFNSVPPCATNTISAALADALATAFIASLGDIKLHIYSGTQPATSTALAGSLSGYTRLITYQSTAADIGGKYGIKWDSVVTGSGIAKRLQSQVCSGVAAATGTATWGVITNVDDTLGAAPTAKRYAFSIGTSGADVNVKTISFTSGKTYAFTSPLTVPEFGIAAELSLSLGTPVITYRDAGGTNGITWDSVTANSGTAKRLESQSVTGTGVIDTNLTYMVLMGNADTLAAGAVPRYLFTVGTLSSGASAILETTAIKQGTIEPIMASFGINCGCTA